MDATLLTDGFGERHFGAAQLGDERRRKRLVKLADQLAQHPEGTLPAKLHDPASYQAMWRLCNHPRVTHQAVLEPHRQLTLRRMREHPRLLLVLHDTTELDYTSKHSLAGQLGQIGDGRGRGYECHNTLAFDPATQEVLGLAHQTLHRRAEVPDHETPAQRRRREDRESRLWVLGSAAVGPPPPGARWVDVADRAADTFEFLAYEAAQAKGYVIRSKHNRALWLEPPGRPTAPREDLLHDYLRAQPAQARHTAAVGGRDGQPPRQARLRVAWRPVWLRPPQVRRGEYEPRPLAVWALRAWEADAPAGVEPVDWILLTNVAVGTAAEAAERLEWYSCRPRVEEFHKAQKTGCGIESPQFTRAERLEPMIALLSVVAVLLLNLRSASRQEGAATTPATAVVPALWVEVVSIWRYKEVRLDLSVDEFFRALARLGGHQDRSTDRPPGWLVLWRGWSHMQNMLEYTLALQEARSD
jgi:transposase-like protein